MLWPRVCISPSFFPLAFLGTQLMWSSSRVTTHDFPATRKVSLRVKSVLEARWNEWGRLSPSLSAVYLRSSTMVLLSNSPSLPEVSTLQFSLTSSVGTVPFGRAPFGRVPFSTESSRRAGFDFTYTDKIYESPLPSSRIVITLKGYNMSLNTKTDGDTNLITTGNDGKQWFY